MTIGISIGLNRWRKSGTSAPPAAPTVSGTISNQSVQQGTGVVTYSTAGAFTGSSLTYSLTGGAAGITINPSTGVVSVDRAVVAVSVFSLTVRATNVSGFAETGFTLTVTAASTADYIITTDAEWTVLMLNSAATLSGKIAEIQGPLGDIAITSKAMTTPLVIRGGAGGSVRRMSFNGTISNVTFRDLTHQMTGWPKTHDSTVMFNTCSLSGMRWESCTFRHGYGAGLVNLDPTANYPEYIRTDNVQTATVTSARYALTFQDPTATSAWIEFFNRGTDSVYYKIGDNTVVATTGDTLATTGTGSTRSSSFNPQTSTHIAILAASGSQQINARTEIGMSAYLADAFNSSGSASATDVYFRDCEVADMANGFKKITPATSGDGVLMDSRTRRVYMDQSAFVVDPGGTLYVLRNSFGIPFARSGIAEANNGDARDPHGDIAQHFGPGIGTLGPLYYAGNRHYMENKRAGVDSQGLFVNSNNFTPSYNRVFSISDIYLGGAPNGITVGETLYPAEATMIYGATVVDPRDITTQTRLRFEDGKNEQIYIGKSLAVGVVGNPLFDQSLDLTGTTNPATVFTDLTAAQTATTRAALETALTTVGAAAGIGAVATVNAVDWSTPDHTQVILWQNIPSGVEWLDLPLQAINTMITLPLRRVINRRASQAVVPGSGVEWRSVATDGTTQIQAWTTSSGTIQPDQFIQIRKMSSASGLTAVDFAVTINGFTQNCAVTTTSAAPAVFHTQSGTGPYFRDPANSTPANTTRMEFRANIYPTVLPGAAVRLFTQESSSCDLELTTGGDFRLYVRDGAATSVLAGVTAATGYALNQWQEIVVDVDHTAGTASITNNGSLSGSWTWTPTGSPTFPTIREISFCGTTAGNNLVPAGWQIEFTECHFTTSAVRTLRKNVSGDAATVNADAWRQGVGNAT